MTLSIITVNLNNRDGLQRTIDSVVSQTFKDFEWIVIDGGSTDGSKELIEQYSSYLSFWVSEPDKGIYNAMNKGVSYANGEYLQFLNSGDIFDNEFVLETVFCQLHTSDIIYGDIKIVKNKVLVEDRHYPDSLSFKYLYNYSLGHNSSFIKHSCLMDYPYNENYRIVSDWEFFIKMALYGKSFRHINTTVGQFDLSGISSYNTELLQTERRMVSEQIVPSSLLTDLTEDNKNPFDQLGLRDVISININYLKNKVKSLIR